MPRRGARFFLRRPTRTLSGGNIAANKEELLVKWLNAILALVDTARFLARRVVPEKFSFTEMKATLHGEIAKPVRHWHWSEIKAATYHQLMPEDHSDGGFQARVFLDL